MRPLSDTERGGLLRVSAVTCAFAMLLLPVAAQSFGTVVEAAVQGEAVVVPTVAPSPPHAPEGAHVRDPFVPIIADETAAKTIAPVLLAFASGVRPVALVEVDGRTVTLALGAFAFGARVTYVDGHIVRLSDGRTMALRGSP